MSLNPNNNNTPEEKITALALRYGIGSLYVYGSRADEIAGLVKNQEITPQFPQSDVDVGLHPQRGRHLSAQERVKICLELEDIFNAARVDLVVLPEADPFLALDIIRGELIYCADAREQAEYELFVLRRAGDLAPFARERWQAILNGKV